jgi:hypothetical protein
LPAVLFGLLLVEPGGDKTASVGSVAPHPKIHFEIVRRGGSQHVFKFNPLRIEAGHGCGQAADPERLTALDGLESVVAEVAPVTEDQIAWETLVREIKGDGLIRTPSLVKGGIDGQSGDGLGDEIDFATGRSGLSISIIGKVVGVAL